MGSQFDDKYTELIDSMNTLKSYYDEVENHIQSLKTTSEHDEIQSIIPKVSDIIASAHELIEEYSESIDSLSSAITAMDNADQKANENEKLNEHLKSNSNGGVPLSKVGVTSSLKKVENKYEKILELAIKRVKALANLSTPTPVAHTLSETSSPSVVSPLLNHGAPSTVNPVAPQSHDQSNHSVVPIHTSNLAMPTLRIEPFDGHNITLWPSYYYQIKSIILDNPSLPDCQKACYVRSSLKGEALALVASIPISADYLTVIMARLRAEYEDETVTQAKLLQSFLSVKSKSTKLSDQLTAVKSMIAIAHSIDPKCGLNGQILQAQIVNSIHPRFIDRVFDGDTQTMTTTLESIERELRTEIRKLELRSTISSMTQSTSPSHSESSSKPPRPPPSTNPSKPPTTSPSPRSTNQSKKPMCVYCDKHEYSSSCTEIVTAKDRKAILNRKSLCHCCFSPTHTTKDCTKSPCPTCKGKHHKSLCEKPSVSACINSNTPIQMRTRLFTAPVVLANPEAHQSSMANVLLDTGSQLSLISRDLVSQLKLKPVSTIEASISGLVEAQESKSNTSSHDVVRFELMTNRGKHIVQAVVRDTGSIVGSIQSQPLSESDLTAIRKTLNDLPNHLVQSHVCPDLLLGVSDSLKLLKDAKSTELPCGYELIESMIGPIVAGASTTPTANHATSACIKDQSVNLKANSVITSPEETLEQKIERTFSVDPAARVYETTEKEARKEADNFVSDHFEKTVEHGPDGYVVRYALNNDLITDLPSNHDLAVSRLSSTVRKLSKDSRLIQFYDSIIKDQIALNQVEHVDPSDNSGTIHYLAHQAVLRPDKPSTPLRIVYDASAHLKGKPSLNDVIYPGPSDLEQIPSILIRSRSRKGLIIADVEKAFLQVKLAPSQRNMLRFIWLKDLSKPVTSQNLLYLRFTVTPFGVNQSPCLLSKVITHHIKHNSNECDPRLVNQLISNIYVDNIIINIDEALSDMFTQSKRLFDGMSMNLRDYASNMESFMSSVPESDRAKDQKQKLLGLIWDTGTDQISVNIPHSKLNDKETKRSMLSTISSPYDPLGLINPLILPARVTVQSLWNESPNWDEVVDDKIRDTFHSQVEDIERFSHPMNRYIHLSETDTITLVAFSDASTLAMATCIYCWSPNHPPSLVISKYRLAPIKSRSTIPKMELEALLMAHTLLEYTVASLLKEFPTSRYNLYCYTDSAIVLHWLKPNFNKSVGTFVCNRIKQIQAISSRLTMSETLSFHGLRHVRSEHNPADHATRGLSSTEMNDPTHQWWIGPSWLQSAPDTWPNPHLSDLQCPLVEIVLPKCSIITHDPAPEMIIDLSRHSTLKKTINVTAYVYRFIHQLFSRRAKNSRNTNILAMLTRIPTPSSTRLSATEKRFALHSLILIEQTRQLPSDKSLKKDSLVMDDSKRVLRVITRLTNSDQSSDFKSPIYIPTCESSSLARLLIHDVHCTSLHASTDIVLNTLKSKYFIPRARPLVKSVLRQCVPCRKTNNLPFKYPQSPPLPGDRVKRTIPFEHTGIDYIGPFQTVDHGKMWVVIYTCFSTRITHMETVSSMLPSSFIQSFKRFCARRGTPSRITSDQGTTFKMASSLLTPLAQTDEINTLFSTTGITWSFTTAHSPWKGGIYERLIRVLKQTLSRSIGQKKLSKEELETVMCEAESLMNSRPMTYISSDEVTSFNGPALRPIDLILPESFIGCHINLLDRGDEYIPPNEENSSRATAIKQLSKTLSIVDHFWKRWSEEYLSTLRDSASSSDPLQTFRASSTKPHVGSIVLVIDESGNTPRSTWKMAKILTLSDTSATLKSHTGRTIEQPINLLIPLEINSLDDPTGIPEPAVTNTTHHMSAHDADVHMAEPNNSIDKEMEHMLLSESVPSAATAQFANVVESIVKETQRHISSEIGHVIDSTAQISDEMAEVLVTQTKQSDTMSETRETMSEMREAQGKQWEMIGAIRAKQDELEAKLDVVMSSISIPIRDMQRALNTLVSRSFPPLPPSKSVVMPTPDKPVATTSKSIPNLADPKSFMAHIQSFIQTPKTTPGPSRTFPKKGGSEKSTAPHPYQRPTTVNKYLCTFCDSPDHLTRNCTAVTSVTARRRAVSDRNQCGRCFRTLNLKHREFCKPGPCTRGCCKEDGTPSEHSDYLCPLNPDLTL